jgi:hypothetical protein
MISKQSNTSKNILKHFKRPGISNMFQLRKTGGLRFAGSQKEQSQDFPLFIQVRKAFRGGLHVEVYTLLTFFIRSKTAANEHGAWT